MFTLERLKTLCKSTWAEFRDKRGRMGRSRFFVNVFITALFCGLYALGLRWFITCLHDFSVPRPVYGNVYFIGVGLLFLLLALGTRALRLSRLRDVGLPVWLDWPFFLLLMGHGLGPIFHVLGIPYLRSVEVITMPPEVRDSFGLIWLAWLLFLVLAPSSRQRELFVRR